MARMVPRQPAEDVASDAERKIFERIRSTLSDEWQVLHSVGLARHPQKPWAELDFVLVGPSGVFCLEIKGGRVSRESGIWLFTDRYGRAHKKAEGPFEQVGKGSSALYKFLEERAPAVKQASLGFGVVFPDFRFTRSGPEIIPEIVYDERDHELPFSRYMDRLSSYWQRRLQKHIVLPATTCERIVTELRGDFDLRPSLRSQARDVNSELLRLTQEQYKILDLLSDNDRVLVRGSAGTGKTLLAIEESKRVARMGARALYCCFNRLLAQHVRRVLAGIQNIAVDTLHSLMYGLLCGAGLKDELPAAAESDLLTKFYPDLAAQALCTLGVDAQFDYLILDEAQDMMTPAYLDVLDLLTPGGLKNGRWRTFYDPKQDVYVAGIGRIETLMKGNPVRAHLGTNCRNTQPIAIHTALLSGYKLEETLCAAGPDVELRFYTDEADQCRQLRKSVDRLLSQRLAQSEIVLLSRRRLRPNEINSRLGPNVEWEDLSKSEHPQQSIGVATIQSFKGLERDVVILADLDDLEGSEALQLAYVGASRARVLLIAFIAASQQEYFSERAREFGRELARKASARE